MELPFFKYHGAGNDFILIDARFTSVNLSQHTIKTMCDRHFGIGADGLMYLEAPRYEGDHFYMVYFNSDGSESTMCGNGGRCIAKFATDCGIAAPRLKFHAIDGAHWAEVKGDQIALGMVNADAVVESQGAHFVDTGSPHHVEVLQEHPEDFIGFTRPLRHAYGDAGANINTLVQQDGQFSIRTYERGVEDETLACGTGAVAAAMVAVAQGLTEPPVRLNAPGGRLTVDFEGTGPFTDVVLTGPAAFVFQGIINL